VVCPVADDLCEAVSNKVESRATVAIVNARPADSVPNREIPVK